MSSAPAFAYSVATSKVAILPEDPGVDELVFGRRAVGRLPSGILGDEIVVGKGTLRILVERPHVGVGRRAVEVVPEFLHVLAVVALGVGEPEHPLLQDRVAAVPHGERKAPALVVVAEPGDAVLAPAIGARAGLVMGEVVPGIAAVAVVLAHRPPLPFAEVWPPPPPPPLVGVLQAAPLGGVEDGAWFGHAKVLDRRARPIGRKDE